MAALNHHLLALVFGLLGNIVSFLVYLAPVPTFYKIYKKKSTEEFQSLPYSVALFSSMLLLYYASLKTTDAFMLITINSFGCVIESIYLTLFLVYAPRKAKIHTLKLLILFNLGAFGLIVLVTYLFTRGPHRVDVVGWICAVFSVCVFAAPLSIIRRVIKTKSVEYMPFMLSLFLTISAITWLMYGVFIHDFYIATPNILGLAFGCTQMLLYGIYKNRKNETLPETKPQDEGNGIQIMNAAETRSTPNNTSTTHPEETAANEGVDNSPIEAAELMV